MRLYSVVARFPQREFEIHRLAARDPSFRAVCSDFEEATAALRYCQGSDAPASCFAEGYQRLLEDLAAEIVTYLNRGEHTTSPR